jgi:hypothetical protein
MAIRLSTLFEYSKRPAVWPWDCILLSLMKPKTKILVTSLVLANGIFFGELAAESHNGGFPIQRPQVMVPEALAPQRLSELINACVLGRPAPDFFPGVLAPPPAAIVEAPPATTNVVSENSVAPADKKEPAATSVPKPPVSDPKVASLRTLLAKCSKCHASSVSGGENLGDIALAFGPEDDHSPGPKKAAGIVRTFARGGKMESQLKLSAAEKQLLADWSAASK